MATLTRITPSGPGYETAAECKAAIIAEVNKQHGDVGGRPLPVTSNFSWITTDGNLPDQYEDIEAGYPLLPRLTYAPGYTVDSSFTNWHSNIATLAADGLPIQVDLGGFFITGDLCGYGPSGATLPTWNTYSEADTAECVLICNITAAVANGTTSITLTTDGRHSYATNPNRSPDLVRFESMPGGWATLNSGTYSIASVSEPSGGPYTFTINIDGSGFGSYTSGGISVGRPYQMAPWGTATPWDDLGEAHATCARLAWLQTQYSSPPRVFLWSNDEFQTSSGNSGRADYNLVQYDPRYRALYPDWATRTEAQRMTDLGDRLIQQYDVFWNSYKSNLSASTWATTIQHIGYGKLPTYNFKDCYGWFQWQYGGIHGSDAAHLSWTYRTYTGGSAEIYDNNWNYDVLAYKAIYSMQNEAMANRYFRDIAEGLSATYWFEGIVWDGYLKVLNQAKYTATYVPRGIDYTPQYYKGWSQYCLWILQPRQWRCFVENLSPDAGYVPYWQVIKDQVAHVHSNATLNRFWRTGTLVENPTVITASYGGCTNITHPYQARTSGTGWDYTTAYCGYPKQYHLTTSLDTAWNLSGGPGACPRASTEDTNHLRSIWTLAYVLGTAPNREWLIYAHSTGISGATLTNVAVTIPGFDTVTLPEVPVEGAFYLLAESTGSQFARPDSDISSTGWITVPPGQALYSVLDEETPSTTDFAATMLEGQTLEVALSTTYDPLSGLRHAVSWEGFGDYTISLRQGSSQEIASWTKSDPAWPTWTRHDESLTETQANLITNYADLRIRKVS